MFLLFLTDFHFVQQNGIASTVHGNVLDLVLSNSPEIYSDVDKCDVDFTTDHAVLCLSIKKTKPERSKNIRFVYDYKHADFSKIKSELQQCDLCNIVLESNDVNSTCAKWHGVTTRLSIINKHVPRVC